MEFVLAQWLGIPSYAVIAVYAVGSVVSAIILMGVLAMSRSGGRQ